MMSYELFKGVMAERIKEFLPPEFQDFQVKLSVMRKVNQSLDVMHVFPPGDGIQMSPNLYMDEMYEAFQECQDLNKILQNAAAIVYLSNKKMGAGFQPLDFSKLTDQVVINLVNTEENQELLAELPHRDILDVSVIYRFIIGQDEGGLATVRVNHGLLKDIGMTEEQLFELAIANTKRMFPMVDSPMDDTLLRVDGIRVLTNKIHIQGAACMLYEEELLSLAQRLGGDFYVIPSSVHDLIVVPERKGEPYLLQMFLRSVNSQALMEETKLSDRIYRYSESGGTLSFAC